MFKLCLFTCTFRLILKAKVLIHAIHSWGSTPWCIFICSLYVLLCLNDFIQILHWRAWRYILFSTWFISKVRLLMLFQEESFCVYFWLQIHRWKTYHLNVLSSEHVPDLWKSLCALTTWKTWTVLMCHSSFLFISENLLAKIALIWVSSSFQVHPSDVLL